MEALAEHRKLLGFDVTIDIDEDGLLVAFKDDGGQTLDGVFVLGFEVDADFLVLFSDGDDLFPALIGKLFADVFGFLLELIAVAIIDADDIDFDAAEAVDNGGDFGLVFLDQLRGHGNEGAAYVDFDVFGAGGAGLEFAEIDTARGMGGGGVKSWGEGEGAEGDCESERGIEKFHKM